MVKSRGRVTQQCKATMMAESCRSAAMGQEVKEQPVKMGN